MFPEVPRTGIFCAFGRKKRQHAAAGPKKGTPELRNSVAQTQANKNPDTQALGSVRRMDELERTSVPCSKVGNAAGFSCSDKNDPLFCGFTLAYFFANWENAGFQRRQRRKSTEKWVVFIMPPTSLGDIASENPSTRIAHRSRTQKTRGAQDTSGSQMLGMLTKGGVICQQKGCSKTRNEEQNRVALTDDRRFSPGSPLPRKS